MRIGFSELLVVFFVALLVLGPDKLPGYAKKLGEALSAFRKASDEATREIRENIVEPLEEAQRPLREAVEPLEELDKAVRGNVKEVQTSLRDVGKANPAGSKQSAPKKTGGAEDSSSNTESAPQGMGSTESAPQGMGAADTPDTPNPARDSAKPTGRTPDSPIPPAETVQPTAPVEYADNL